MIQKLRDGLVKASDTIKQLLDDNKELKKGNDELKSQMSDRNHEISTLKHLLSESSKLSVPTVNKTHKSLDVDATKRNNSFIAPICSDNLKSTKKRISNSSTVNCENRIRESSYASIDDEFQYEPEVIIPSINISIKTCEEWLACVKFRPSDAATWIKSNENIDLLIDSVDWMSKYSLIPYLTLWNNFSNDSDQSKFKSETKRDFSLSWIILCTLLMDCCNPSQVPVNLSFEYANKSDLMSLDLDFDNLKYSPSFLIEFINIIASQSTSVNACLCYLEWLLKFSAICLSERITEKYLLVSDFATSRDKTNTELDLIDEAFSEVWKTRSFELSGCWNLIDVDFHQLFCIVSLLFNLSAIDNKDSLIRVSNVFSFTMVSVSCTIGWLAVTDRNLRDLENLRQSIISSLFCVCYSPVIPQLPVLSESLCLFCCHMIDLYFSDNNSYHHLFPSTCGIQLLRYCHSECAVDSDRPLSFLTNPQTVTEASLINLYCLAFIRGPIAIYNELRPFISHIDIQNTLSDLNLMAIVSCLLKALRNCCVLTTFVYWPSSDSIIDEDSDMYNSDVRNRYVELEWQMVHENIIGRLSTSALLCFDKNNVEEVSLLSDKILAFCDLLIENLMSDYKRLVMVDYFVKKISSCPPSTLSPSTSINLRRISDCVSSLKCLPIGVVINLKSRPDRWIRLENRCCRDQTLLIERVNADPSTEEIGLDWNSRLNSKFDHGCEGKDSVEMTSTERKCASSHLRLWCMVANGSINQIHSLSTIDLNDFDFSSNCRKRSRNEVDSMSNYILILEDDAELSYSWNPKQKQLTNNYVTNCANYDIPLPLSNQMSKYRFVQQLRVCIQEAPQNLDFLFLGYIMSSFARSKRFSNHLLIPEYLWQLHCYIISKSTCKLICDMAPLRGPIDNYVSALSYDGGLAIVCTTQPLAYQPNRKVMEKRKPYYRSDIVHSGSDWEKQDA